MAYTVEQFAQIDVDTLHESNKVKRQLGCLCQWEEGDSPCPVHISIDDIIDQNPIGFVHNLGR